MRVLSGLIAPLLCLTFASANTRAADVDKDKLIGAWEMILPEEVKKLDLKIVLEFAKDGKATMSMDGFGKKETKGGTWKLDGDKLTITPTDEKDKTETITIKSLTADKLTVADKSGKDMSFKKKAPPAKPLAFGPETLAFAREVADEPKSTEVDSKKLIGKWSVPGQKAEVEFAREGKLILTAEGIKIEGKYKLEKDKLTIVMDFGGKEMSETMTVKSLSDTKLVTIDSKGKVEELTKSK